MEGDRCGGGNRQQGRTPVTLMTDTMPGMGSHAGLAHLAVPEQLAVYAQHPVVVHGQDDGHPRPAQRPDDRRREGVPRVVDVGDIGSCFGDEPADGGRGRWVPGRQTQRSGRPKGVRRVAPAVLDHLVAAAAEDLRFGLDDCVFTARFPVPRVKLQNPHGYLRCLRQKATSPCSSSCCRPLQLRADDSDRFKIRRDEGSLQRVLLPPVAGIRAGSGLGMGPCGSDPP